MSEGAPAFDLNAYAVPPMDLQASYVMPGHFTTPAHSTHQALRMQSATESYKDWMHWKTQNKTAHSRLNFDRMHWQTQSLIEGALQGDKEGIDTKKYNNPEHPQACAWWWAQHDEKDREVYNARLRHLRRFKPNYSEPLLNIHSETGSLLPLKGGIPRTAEDRRKARRADRKKEKQALWNEIWRLQAAPEEKKELFEAMWDEQKQHLQHAQSTGSLPGKR
jgi:hypothetical protein